MRLLLLISAFLYSFRCVGSQPPYNLLLQANEMFSTGVCAYSEMSDREKYYKDLIKQYIEAFMSNSEYAMLAFYEARSISPEPDRIKQIDLENNVIKKIQLLDKILTLYFREKDDALSFVSAVLKKHLNLGEKSCFKLILNHHLEHTAIHKNTEEMDDYHIHIMTDGLKPETFYILIAVILHKLGYIDLIQFSNMLEAISVVILSEQSR